MQFTVQELAACVQGKIHGDGDRVVRGARVLKEAGPDDVTFLEHERNARLLKNCAARVVVVPHGLAGQRDNLGSAGAGPLTLIEVADPLNAFVAIVRLLQGEPETAPPGIDPRAVLHASAVVGPQATVEAFAVVGAGSVLGARCRIHPRVVIGRNCRVGDDVVLYPGVVLYDGVVVGNRVIVHANAVLGADGFGYRLHQGRHVKVPQLGTVEIGDDVEIGACTTIDRGTFQATSVGAGTKIDNLVMIGHNCRIGRHNLLVSQVGIAGSCTTGDYVVLAGQVGVADHVHIADGAVIGARAGLFRDVPAGGRMWGAPAQPESDAKRIYLCLTQLPQIVRDVRQLKRALKGSGPAAGGPADNTHPEKGNEGEAA